MEKETQIMLAALIVLVILLFVWDPMSQKSASERMQPVGRFGPNGKERLSPANAAKAWGKTLMNRVA